MEISLTEVQDKYYELAEEYLKNSDNFKSVASAILFLGEDCLTGYSASDIHEHLSLEGTEYDCLYDLPGTKILIGKALEIMKQKLFV